MTARAHVAMCSPLEDAVRRLSSISGNLAYRLGVPSARGWLSLAALDDSLLACWYRQTLSLRGDHRAAANEVGSWLAYLAVAAWAMPVLAVYRLPLHHLEHIAVHFGDQHPDAIAYTHPQVGVLPGDPYIDHLHAHPLESWEEMADQLVIRLEQVRPLFDRLRNVVRIGRPALWGQLADSIGGTALWMARELGKDQSAIWSLAETVIDGLAGANPDVRNRPRLFPVTYSRQRLLFQVKGTCCLYYRSQVTPDPGGEGYCITCPLRTDESRHRLLLAYLDERDVREKEETGEEIVEQEGDGP